MDTQTLVMLMICGLYFWAAYQNEKLEEEITTLKGTIYDLKHPNHRLQARLNAL